MSKNHIYPEEIRRFERELIEFIVESGKNKRKSDIESHLLAYFFCHPSLTQKEIQELSANFREKKISKGSISTFLNQYEGYGVIIKTKIPEKKGNFRYALKDRNIKALMATGLEAGLEKVQNWIEYIEERSQALTEIMPEPKQIELHAILVERLKEMRDFLVFHDNLMKNFFSGKFNIMAKPEEKVSGETFNKIKKKGIKKIEEEIVHFIQNNPLFMIEEVKYLPIFSYFLTRKRLTQSQLQKLTGLSSGTISEGIGYFLRKKYIELDKIKGIRKRFYVMPSIGYTNYLKQYQRFKLIKELKDKIEQLCQEMTKRETELIELNGFEIILQWIKEALKIFAFVETGIKIFEKALNHFEPQKG